MLRRRRGFLLEEESLVAEVENLLILEGVTLAESVGEAVGEEEEETASRMILFTAAMWLLGAILAASSSVIVLKERTIEGGIGGVGVLGAPSDEEKEAFLEASSSSTAGLEFSAGISSGFSADFSSISSASNKTCILTLVTFVFIDFFFVLTSCTKNTRVSDDERAVACLKRRMRVVA
jgi:hypothetical protein